jgi:hypothetical protein
LLLESLAWPTQQIHHPLSGNTNQEPHVTNVSVGLQCGRSVGKSLAVVKSMSIVFCFGGGNARGRRVSE